MRRLYHARRNVMVRTLAKYFGDGAKIHGDAAGLHMMVTCRSPHLHVRSSANGVQLLSAEAYYFSDAPQDTYILGFSAVTEREIREGLKRLAEH